MRWFEKTFMSFLGLRRISWGALVLLCACSGVPHQNDWITVGHTTREEVVDAYGEPDLVMAVEVGETVVYRPRDVSHSATPSEIPTAQAGPQGRMTTKMETINRGLGAGSVYAGLMKRPDHELRIRYDAHGIVQELIQ